MWYVYGSMTRKLIAAAAVLSLLVACGSSKDDDKKSDEKTADDSSQASRNQAPAPSKADGLPVATRLHCATLLPTDVVTRHFPDATVTQYDPSETRAKLGLPPDPTSVRCDIDADELPISLVNFTCGIYLDDELISETHSQVTEDKLIAGLGRSAAELHGQISIADDDTACIIVMSYLGKHRDALVALAKDIVPLVTPEAIGAK